MLSGYKSGLFLLWPANCNSFINSAWKSPGSQKHPQLFHWSLVGDTRSGAPGTEFFKSTEMVSSVNVNFFLFASHW